MTKARAAQVLWTSIVRLVMQSGSTVSVLLINMFFGQASVALYSVAFAAISLIVVVFRNGLPIFLLRSFVEQTDPDGQSLYRGFLATLVRSPAQYAKAAVLIVVAILYLYISIGPSAVRMFALMSPLLLLMPVVHVRSSYHKAIGEPVQASIYDSGLLHLSISGLVLVSLWLGATELSTVFAYGFLFFAAAGVVLLVRMLHATRNVAPITDPGAQRAILANNVLAFVFRNGFPLFFAAFMATDDLGRFRVEERLFFLLMFLYFLYEAVSVKRLIAVFSDSDDRARLRTYTRMSGTVFAGGMVAALAMLVILSIEPIAAVIGYSWHGSWTVLMALSIPFYILTLFNSLVLNLVGRHSAVTRCMLAGAVVFLFGTFAVYSSLGIDGVRLAYFSGGVAGAALSTIAVLLSQRRAAP